MLSDSNPLSKTAITRRAYEAFEAHRVENDMSHREMAEFLEVGEDTYQKWGNPKEKRYVSAETIALFCFHADKELSWIMFGKKPLRKAI